MNPCKWYHWVGLSSKHFVSDTVQNDKNRHGMSCEEMINNRKITFSLATIVFQYVYKHLCLISTISMSVRHIVFCKIKDHCEDMVK